MVIVLALPDYLKIQMKRGATFHKEFTWKNAGVAVPITGWVGTCEVKSSVNATGVLFSPVITVIDGPAGRWDMDVATSVSAAIPSTAETLQEVDTYWYDVRFDTGAGVEYPIQGDIELTGAVTEP